MWTIIKTEDYEKYLDSYPELCENPDVFRLHTNEEKGITLLPSLFYTNYPSTLLQKLDDPVEPIDINFDFSLKLRSGQKEIATKIQKMMDRGEPIRGIIKARPGFGKALPLSSKLLYLDGFKPMKDCKVGDLILGRDGKPHEVQGVFPQGEQKVFKIVFDDGSSCRCTDEHLWTYLDKSHNWQTKELKEFRDNFDGLKFPLPEECEGEYRKVSFDPYNIGVLIGGTLSLEPDDETLTISNYVWNSLEVRKEVVRGLHSVLEVAPDDKTFSIRIGKHTKLRQDFINLYRSLGYRVIEEENELTIEVGQDNWNRIVSIEEDGIEECQCIKVDSPDSLFITDQYVVTHNTILATYISKIVGKKTLIVVDSENLLKQWVQEIVKSTSLTTDNIGIIKGNFFCTDREITVGMVQTLLSKFKNEPKECFEKIKNSKFGLVIFDEVHKSSSSEKYAKVSTFFTTSNILGLSATPYKYGYQDILMKNVIGDLIYDTKDYDLVPDIFIHRYSSGLNNYRGVLNKVGNFTMQLSMYNKFIVKSEIYIQKVYQYTKEDLEKGHRVIIICWTEKQVQTISLYLTAHGITNTKFYGKSRNYSTNDKVLVVTYSFAGTGFDYKELSSLVYACPISGKVSLIQTAGRVLRECPDKPKPHIHYLADNTFPLLFIDAVRRVKTIFTNEFGSNVYED